MFRSGRAVAAAIEAARVGADSPLSEAAIQLDGADRAVERVFEQQSSGHVVRDDELLRNRTRGDRRRQFSGRDHRVPQRPADA